MGQFSWLDCRNTKKQILDNVPVNTYLLIPKEFGGGHIAEDCYDGYGNFGKKDVYELVADWNRNFIPKILELSDTNLWKCPISQKDRDELLRFYNTGEISANYEKRFLGITMSCYDEDNEALPYPIKVTHDETAIYEKCNYSPSDPNQGWPAERTAWDCDENSDEEYDKWANSLLWNLLKEHRGHNIEIAWYGNEDDPVSITLEDMDTSEVILDAGVYTICAREDV